MRNSKKTSTNGQTSRTKRKPVTKAALLRRIRNKNDYIKWLEDLLDKDYERHQKECERLENDVKFWKGIAESWQAEREFWKDRSEEGKDDKDFWKNSCKGWEKVVSHNKVIHQEELGQKDEEITRLRQIIYNLTGRNLDNELIITPSRIKAVLPTWPCN